MSIMIYQRRSIETLLLEYLSVFPVVAVTGLLQLLPFDISELPNKAVPIEQGFYPEQVMRNFKANEAWYGSYFETYVQRDVRSLSNIGDLHDFSRLVKLLAANVSQQLNTSYYAKALGVSLPTIRRWFSVLEISYVICLLKPYHSNLGKRIVKSPKICASLSKLSLL